MHSKSARMLCISWVTELAGMPMLSAYWADWFAFITLSKNSLVKLEKAERDMLSPCARRFWAKVLLAKLNARSSADRWSAIWRQWYA